MPTFRRALTALALVVVSVAVAAGAALAVDRIGIGPSAIVPLAAAIVVAGTYWRWPAEGLLAFGTFSLVADTLEHWLQLDVLLFDEIGLLLLGGVALTAGHLALARVRLGWLEGAILVLAIAGILSSVINGVPIVTWVAGLFLLLKGVAFFELVRFMRLTSADAERMGIVMLLVAGIIGGLGFLEWFDQPAFQAAFRLPLHEQIRGEVPVIRSIFLHPAQYGWLTAYASLLCYAVVITRRSWWALPAGLLFNLGTFVSGRRTPLLGVGAAVAIGLAWWSARLGWRRALVRLWAPVAVLAIVGLLVAAPSFQRLAEVTIEEYVPSLDYAGEILATAPRADVIAAVHPRVALYAGSAAIARDSFPLGGGLGRFGSHLSREDYSPLYTRYGLDQIRLLQPGDPQAATDAFWPMVLGETGLIGAVAALVLFVGMAVVLWKAASADGSRRNRMIALAALLVVVEGLIRSATSSVYVAPPIGYFVLGTAGVALAATSTPEPAGTEDAGAD
ncbi:MAG TPA: hypothetical protein VF365_12675 [Candidatus Limnocylindria bacterium]